MGDSARTQYLVSIGTLVAFSSISSSKLAETVSSNLTMAAKFLWSYKKILDSSASKITEQLFTLSFYQLILHQVIL